MFERPAVPLAGPMADGTGCAATGNRWSRVSPVGLSLLVAILPKCSVCLMVHGSILAAMGLITIPQPPRPVVAGSLVLAVALLARSAHARRRYALLAMGTVAAVMLLAELTHSHGAHAMHAAASEHSPLATWVASGLLIAASIWNAWPVARPAALPSPACLPCGSASAQAAG